MYFDFAAKAAQNASCVIFAKNDLPNRKDAQKIIGI